jgi:hypothetical protein
MKAGSAVASGVSGVERAGRRQAESSSSSDDREVAVEGATMHRIGAKRNDRVEITEHGQAENGIDGDIRTKRKRNSDGGAGGVDGVQCRMTAVRLLWSAASNWRGRGSHHRV